jgi:hypothetical protein
MKEKHIIARKRVRVVLLLLLLASSLAIGVFLMTDGNPWDRRTGTSTSSLYAENSSHPLSGTGSQTTSATSDSIRAPRSAGSASTAWLLAEVPKLPPSTSESAKSAIIAPVYLDPLIDPGISVDPPLTARPPERLLGLPGTASAEYRLFNQNTSGSIDNRYTEHGVATQVQQDTATYGRFDFRAALINGDTNNIVTGGLDSGHYINLAQRDFALTSHWMMNNEIGDIRARVPTLLSQGYYIRLPEPLVEGISSEIRSANSSMRVTSGTLGTMQGRTFPVFSTILSNGSATGVDGTYRFSPEWQAVAQVWSNSKVLTGAGAGEESFTSMAGSMRYDGQQQGKAQVGILTNDNGAVGFWLDGEKRHAAWLHNLGVYRMDPDLEWIDRNSTIIKDTQGLYWRASTRSASFNNLFGLDWMQTNIDSNLLRPTRNNINLYSNVGYRYSFDTGISGYLSLGDENVTGAGLDVHDNVVSARGILSTRFSTGSSSWLLGTTMRNGTNESQRLDASWDHYWNPGTGFSGLRSGIYYAKQSASLNDFQETSLRAGGQWARRNFDLSTNASIGYLNSDIIDSDVSSSITFSFGWRIANSWRLGADINFNHNALVLTTTGESRVSDTQLLASLRYDANWGRPQALIGRVKDEYGRGAVRGVLFLDQNGNGARDPGEPGVPNVTIVLDRGFSTETNANGEFSYNPVPSGVHQIAVNVANVPLPWNMSEERPFEVTVRTRETSTIDIPLISMRPN